jgi:ectoine hydroxylase-related dioxygenase (phytanoyl-CoA dioxygenase family)
LRPNFSLHPQPTQQLDQDGFAVLPDLLEAPELQDIDSRLAGVLQDAAGTRRLLDAPWCVALAQRLARDARVREALPHESVPVQCTLFVKSLARNWLVSLHQDLCIPVAERITSPECSGWSEKEGQIFVQPPVAVLEQMLAIRLHLDAYDENSGALRTVPGSHDMGRLAATTARQLRERRGEVSVAVPRGGAMLMKPLLLHASSKTSVEKPRRVLHFVFGPASLPCGLRWPTINTLQTERSN